MPTNDSSNLTIRRPTPQDWQEWLRMRLALWPDTTAAEHEAEMQDYLPGNSRDAAFVAVRPQGNLGGFIEVSQRSYADGCDTRPVGYIEGWYVDPDLRRQGVGAALVQAAEQWAASQGCSEMGSDCEEDNETSLLAHQALGYAISERLVHFCKVLPAGLATSPPSFPAFIYLIRPTRPGFFEGTTPEEDAILSKHYEHLRQQTEAGVVMLAGPCLDETFGIVVFRAASPQEAEAFMNSDPAVQARVMFAELHPFRVSLIRRTGERA